MLKRSRRISRLPPQETIPSQVPSRRASFAAYEQADMAETIPFVGKKAAGFTKPVPYVITQYDARPINCIDFVATYTTAEQAGADLRTFDFVVPAGRIAVVRRLDIKVYMNAAARDIVTAAPAAAITASFLIDGSAVEQANNIRLDDAICGIVTVAAGDSTLWTQGLSVPLYFLAPENSTVRLNVSNATVGLDFSFVAPVLSGNLLLAEGVNPTSEPGTKVAIPFVNAKAPRRAAVLRPAR